MRAAQYVRAMIPSSSLTALCADSTKPRFATLCVLSLAAGLTLLSSAQGEMAFAPAVTYAVGDRPLGLVMGDLNGDGWNDVVVTNRDANTATVFLNVADGTGALIQTDLLTTGLQPRSPALGDFDGDGDLDLVTPHWEPGSTTVGVHLNLGSGQFGPRVDLTVGSRPRTAATADFDGDGDTDIAVANSGSGNISILLNEGDGSFASHIMYGSHTNTGSISVGNIDNDGDLDLVATSRQTDVVWVSRNDGSGVFTTVGVYTVGSVPRDETLADLDGDGDLDIVVADGSSASLTVLLNDGTGLYTVVATLPAPGAPHAVVSNDFDGDGDVDVATTALSNRLHIFENDGAAGFGDAQTFNEGVGVSFLTEGDLDGDGRADLVIADQSVDTIIVLLNRSSPPVCIADLDNDNLVGLSDLLVVLSSWGTCPGCLGDLDGDGEVGFNDLLLLLAAWGAC